MENFIVSARKYRPATFDTVVGQASITTTLKNAIKNNHLAQAFLFCGPRGVGKTTCARILAKTINCENISDKVEACDQCESCKSFSTSQSFNIYELDAASNNSVDDIRNLVEQVRFAPHLGKYKIYIIDEVHMLSTQAFNAFLKTLEEPPAYAIFILATTEKQKIIPTILSRCQIFDFNRIRVDDIASHLGMIAEKENVVADPEAMHIIAQKADGALRDALSMFDQIVSYAGSEVTYKHAIENLNILDYDYYFKVTDKLLEGNFSETLLIFDQILKNGFDGHNFINGLSQHFRDLLVSLDGATVALMEVSQGTKDRYLQQAGVCSANYLLSMMDIVNLCDVQYKSARNQRLHVELTLLKLCSLVTRAGETPAPQPAAALPQRPAAATPAPARAQPPIASDAPAAVAATAPAALKAEAPAATKVEEPLPPKPAPAKASAPATVKSPTLSINDFLGEDAKPTADTEGTPAKKKLRLTNDYTTEQFEKAWKEIADHYRNAGRMNLYAALTKRSPVVVEGHKYLLYVDNLVMMTEVREARADFIEDLRAKLGHSDVQLDMEQVVADSSDTDNRLYTTTDKYKRMVEKNPVLQDLKKQLDLEIDF